MDIIVVERQKYLFYKINSIRASVRFFLLKLYIPAVAFYWHTHNLCHNSADSVPTRGMPNAFVTCPSQNQFVPELARSLACSSWLVRLRLLSFLK